jgi:glutamate decarboxylase
MEGFRSIQQHSREVATHLGRAVSRLDDFELLSDGSELPVFAFRVVDGAGFTVYDVSKELRSRGWLVPAYPMPPGMSDVHVLRVVVRHGFTPDLAALFLEDLERSVQELRDRQPRPAPIPSSPNGFRH